jgi:hypothetical protein
LEFCAELVAVRHDDVASLQIANHEAVFLLSQVKAHQETHASIQPVLITLAWRSFPGGGVRPAVESGLLAAEIIRSSEGLHNRARLALYSDLLVTRLNPGHAYVERIAKDLPTHLHNRLARMLLKSEWFCRRVVLDRWFLQ